MSNPTSISCTQNHYCRRGFCSGLILLLALLWSAFMPATLARAAQPVTIVDVLVLYTPQARDGAGGTSAILTNINLAMFEANTVLQNSLVNVRLRLVSATEIEYTESGSVTTDLARLQNPADPVLGRASVLRNQYAADLVCMVTETGPDYDFNGFQGPSAENAFSIIRRPFLSGLNEFPVVLSFNFGCQLERGYANSLAAFPYAYGFTFGTSNGIYSTVEAFFGQRLPFFSNPNIIYQGTPAGVPVGASNAANNALVFNHTAPIVAAFRSPAPVTLPPAVQFTAPTGNTNLPVLMTSGTNLMLLTSVSDPDGFISNVNFYYQDATSGVSHAIGHTTNAPYGVIWSNIPPGNWKVIAQAVDDLGATTYADSGLTLQVKPANDNLAKATVLTGTNITIVGTTMNATLENGEPNWNNGAPSVWYAWTAPASGAVILTISNAPFVFNIYTGNTVSNLTDVIGTGAFMGYLVFPVVGGTKYLFPVAISPASSNVFSLQLAFYPKPANDNFTNRTVISGGWIELTNNSAGGAIDPNTPVQNAGNNPTLWYSWTPTVSGIATVSCPSGQFVEVFTGSVLTNLTSLGFDRSITFPASAGTTYTVAVPGDGGIVIFNLGLSTVQLAAPTYGARFIYGSNINITASVTSNDKPVAQVEFFANGTSLGVVTNPPYNLIWTNALYGANVLMAQATDTLGHVRASPSISISAHAANDNFSNAILLSGSEILTNGTTTGASTEPGEFVPDSGNYGSTWYAWTAPATATYHATLSSGSGVWGYGLRIYTGSNLANLILAPLLDSTNYAFSMRDDFVAQAGTTYHFGILNVGDFTLQIDPVPANNDFTNAFLLTGLNVATNGDDTFATVNPVDPFPGAHGQVVWYSWTAPANGVAVLSVTGTNYVPGFAVSSGTTVSNLTSIASGITAASFNTFAGTTYKIEVNGNNVGGAFALNLSLATLPSNDAFATRQTLIGIQPSIQGNTLLATFESAEAGLFPGFYGVTNNGSVWYSWIAPADGVVEISSTDNIAVFTGNALTNLITIIPSGSSVRTFAAADGTEYEIAVVGNSSPGNFTLSIVLPKAQFASPADGAVFPGPGNFEIAARTIDIDGAVVSVGFYDGANLIGTVNQAPFQIEYTNVPAGEHSLSMVATDENGFVSTNVPIAVRVQSINDNFAQRFVINGMTTNIVADISGASTEPGEFLPGGATGRTLWWTWTVPANGTVTIGSSGFTTASPSLASFAKSITSSQGNAGSDNKPADLIIISPGGGGPPGSTTGPLVAVYTNATLTNLSLCASNSALYLSGIFTVNPGTGEVTQNVEWYVLPSFSFPVVAGQTYQISLDGVNGNYGTASMSFNFVPPPSPPANDNFAQRTRLSGTSIFIGATIIAATREPGEPLDPDSPNARTVWYTWTAPLGGQINIAEVDGATEFGQTISSFDIGVYTGSQLTNLTPVAVQQASVSFNVQAGVTYQIGFSSPTGREHNFSFSLVYPNAPPTPPTAAAAQSGMLAGRFQLGVSGSLGQSFVVQASTDLLSWETIDIDTMPGDGTSFMDAESVLYPKRFYRVIPLEKFFDAQPVGSLAPANDSFTNRLNWGGDGALFVANNQLATSEAGEPLLVGASGKTLWWNWTASADGSATITVPVNEFSNQFDSTTNGPRFVNGPLVSVFAGNAITNLSLITNNSFRSTTANYYGSTAGPLLVYTNCTFPVFAGSNYTFSVDGCNGSAGLFGVTLTANLHPIFFNGEVAQGGGVYSLTFTNGNLFGLYKFIDSSDLTHQDLGAEYFTSNNDAQKDISLFDFKSQHWWYTNPEQFPYIFDFTLNAWLYYYPDPSRPGHYTTNPRKFYNTVTKQIFAQ